MRTMDHEQTLATILAMRRQEEMEYSCTDYFFQSGDELDSLRQKSEADNTYQPPCDAHCRSTMCYWMIKLIDFFPQMSRETAAFAMSYLDRFLQTEAGHEALVSRKQFQLAAVACLYSAMKISECSAVSPRFFEQLSQNEYTQRDLEEMELKIFQAIDWRLNTPTAHSFLREFLGLIPPIMLDESLRDEVFNLAVFQVEVALAEYDYVTVNDSLIAYCALVNAVDTLHVDTSSIAWFIAEAAEIDFKSQYKEMICSDLNDDCARHAELDPVLSSVYDKRCIREDIDGFTCNRKSPRTVISTQVILQRNRE